MSHTGDLIKQIREKRGVSQKWVADRMGYSSPQFFSNVERGLCPFPEKQITAFSRLLKVEKSTIIEAKVLDYRAQVLREVNGRQKKRVP